jgi:hypothetical protein
MKGHQVSDIATHRPTSIAVPYQACLSIPTANLPTPLALTPRHQREYLASL